MDSHVLLKVITSIKVKGFESVEAADQKKNIRQ